MRRRVEETLDLLGIADLRGRDLRTLSGGEQQRVAIGSVLTMHPRVLVLDEPTSALDPTAAEDVLATLTRLVHDLGVSVLMAEHRLERVVPFADRIVLLTGDGRVHAGPPADVLAVSPVVPPIVELGRRARLGPAAGDRPRRTAPGRAASTSATRRRPTAGSTTSRSRWRRRSPSGRAARPSPSARRRVRLRARHGDRADGPQRLGQVDACCGRCRAAASAAPARVDGGRRRPGRASPAPSARAWSGWCPQTAADLLYLETVAEECAAADGGSGECRALLDRLVPGIPDDDPPPRPVRGTAARARAGGRAGRRPAGAPARRADPRPRLPGQGRAGRGSCGGSRDDGHAVLVATHDVEFAAEAADEVVVLAEGEVVSDGPTRRGARRVAGVRAAGDQDPRARLAARRRGAGGAMSSRPSRREPAVPPLAALASSRDRLGRRADDAGLAAAGPAAGRASQVGPPFVFLALLPVVIVVVLAEVTEGGIDPRVLAMLGVLSAVNAVLRGLSPGTGRRRAGVLPADPGRAGVRRRASASCWAARRCSPRRCSPAGSGRGCRSRCSCSAWVGMGAGLLPRRVTGRAEIAMLAAYGVVAAYAYGLLLNLSSWPFVLGIAVPGHTGLAFVPGDPLLGEPAPVPRLHAAHLDRLASTPAARSPTPSRSSSSGRRC